MASGHGPPLTFSLHPHLEALLESAVLTLVPVVLVNRAAFVAATLIGEVPPD